MYSSKQYQHDTSPERHIVKNFDRLYELLGFPIVGIMNTNAYFKTIKGQYGYLPCSILICAAFIHDDVNHVGSETRLVK